MMLTAMVALAVVVVVVVAMGVGVKAELSGQIICYAASAGPLIPPNSWMPA